jgi:hypothetical protein
MMEVKVSYGHVRRSVWEGCGWETKGLYIGNRQGMIAPRVSAFGVFVRGRAGRNMRFVGAEEGFGLIWSLSNTLNPAPAFFGGKHENCCSLQAVLLTYIWEISVIR